MPRRYDIQRWGLLVELIMIYLAVMFFSAAAYIDFPYPDLPSDNERKMGNFCCSCGYVCLCMHFALK